MLSLQKQCLNPRIAAKKLYIVPSKFNRRLDAKQLRFAKVMALGCPDPAPKFASKRNLAASLVFASLPQIQATFHTR